MDEETGSVYLCLNDEETVVLSEEVKPGVVLDFNDQDEIVGIEIYQRKFNSSRLSAE